MHGGSRLWKKAQRMLGKKQISLIINNLISSRRPFCTHGVFSYMLFHELHLVIIVVLIVDINIMPSCRRNILLK